MGKEVGAKHIMMHFRHRIRCVMDAPAKRRHMDEMGCYRAMSGVWCSSHGAILYTSREYRDMTLEELMGEREI